MITTTGAEGNAYSLSTLLAKLNANQSYLIPAFDGGADLPITVLSIGNGVASVQVGAGTPPPPPPAPPTPAPPTQAPPTVSPPTFFPPTPAPPTPAPPTPAPPTPDPPCDGISTTLSLTFDNYPQETSWTLTGQSLSRSGNGDGQSPGSSVEETFCLADGAYVFTINDTYGDGICCAYGQGGYTILSADGSVNISGGEFSAIQTESFTIGTTVPPTAAPPTAAPPTPAPPTQVPPTPSPPTPSPPTPSPPTPAPSTPSPTPGPTTAPTPTPTSGPTPGPTPTPPTVAPPTPAPPTGAPTTAAPTPSVTPETTFAPTTPGSEISYLSCGNPGGNRCGGETSKLASHSESHPFRCCANNQIGNGWIKRANCDVWAESLQPCEDATHDQASQRCEDVGARLCTRDEYEARCTRGTGCNYDSKLNWSSTTPDFTQFTRITFDDFEPPNRWGNFIDGGASAWLYTKPTANGGNDDWRKGTASARLRSKQGVASSIFTKDLLSDVSSFGEIKVKFWAYVVSFEGSEDFFLEYTTDGTDWITAAQYINNVNVANNEPKDFEVVLADPSGAPLDLSGASVFQVRIRCDASGNGDVVYLDDIEILGRSI